MQAGTIAISVDEEVLVLRLVLPSRSWLGLVVAFCVAAGAGCTADTGGGRACGLSAFENGCFCTTEEVHTEPAEECSASQSGFTHCCDDPETGYCYCPRPPRCYVDGAACRCNADYPPGVLFVTRCVAEAGTVCCIDPATSQSLGQCTCGYTTCPLPDVSTMTSSCGPEDVSTCDPEQATVTSCEPLES